MTVVIPTRNESECLPALLTRLTAAVAAIPADVEVLFVDDSDDETPQLISELAPHSLRARVLHRPRSERDGGLGGALLEGFAAARGEVVAVMDADLQHPPEMLPELVAPLLNGERDVAIGSRYAPGGMASGLSTRWRRFVSVQSRRVVHVLFPRTRGLSDPGGGLFAFRCSVIGDAHLHPDGYKMLPEVLVRGNWDTTIEISYDFAPRAHGKSNATARQGARFARHMARLFIDARVRPKIATGSRSAVPTRRRAPSADVVDLRAVPELALPTGNDPLRILLVATEAPPVTSGVARSIGRLAEGLRARGHHVDLLSSLEIGRVLVGEARLSALTLRWRALAPKLAGYDVINLHGPAPTFTDAFLTLHRSTGRGRCPLVYTHHFDIQFERMGWFFDLYNKTHRRLAQEATRIVVSTPSYAALMQRASSDTPVDIIPWGVDVEAFQASARNLRSRDEPLRVLFLGQMRPYKGVETLLEAAAGSGFALTLVGGGPHEVRYRALARKIVSDAVFPGWVDDAQLRALYGRHDVIVLPSVSRLEAFGLVLLEGMAAGCVPVASDLPGVRDVASPSGVVFQTGNAAALRAALLGLDRDRERLLALSRASQERVRRFGVEATVSGFDRVLRAAAGSVASPAHLDFPAAEPFAAAAEGGRSNG